METEKDYKPAFLVVLVRRKSDGSLVHTVYRKTTRTDLYLHAESEHNPAHESAVLSTFVHRQGLSVIHKAYKKK